MPPQVFPHFCHAAIGEPDEIRLDDFSWRVEPGQSWVITGANGSGKSAVAAALAGALPVRRSQAAPAGSPDSILPPPSRVALVSSESLSQLFIDERLADESEFTEGGVDQGTLGRHFLERGLAPRPGTPDADAAALLAGRFGGLGIESLLDRGIKYLSTGELRKLALCRHLLAEPDWLVLDELRDGLDQGARAWLAERLESLIQGGSMGLILVSDRYEAIPSGISHVLVLEQGRVAFAGSRAEYERGGPRQPGGEGEAGKPEASAAGLDGLLQPGSAADSPDTLVRFRQVTVAWSGRTVLDRLDWTLRRGEHTLIRGPNGCGKTTLLRLISGDNPQVYANDVWVLGHQRGSGESVWDIKRLIGMVSYQLHVEYLYRCQSSVEEVIVSGFHDSIGLYERAGDHELLVARAWLAELGLSERAHWPFTRLSYGEQRAVLIARAVVKQPPLLILDEPCHGLDREHRHHALGIAEHIGRRTGTTLLYVTHDPAEYLPCLRRVLEWNPAQAWRESAFRP